MNKHIQAIWKTAGEPPKQKEEAKGIPSRKYYGSLTKIPQWEPVIYSLQKHLAEKAGPHYDLRLGDKKGLYSWVVPKGLPESPEQKRLAIRQPMHSPKYAGFEGEIPEGYGKGKVSLEDKGSAVITRADKDRVDFTVAHKGIPKRFSMIRTQGNDWLVRMKDGKPAELLQKFPKEKMKRVDKADIQKYIKGPYRASAKVDGAAALMDLSVRNNRIYGFRERKGGEGRIEYTEKLPSTAKQNIPDKYKDLVLRGEIYAVKDNGEVAPVQELSGILNSSVEKAVKKQKEKGTRLKFIAFGIKNKELTPEEEERILKEIEKATGGEIEAMPQLKGMEEKKRLVEDIWRGAHPKTSEGVVFTDLDKRRKAYKVLREKIRDIIIKDIEQAKGKHSPERAGRLAYAFPEKPEKRIGMVGSGLSHELAKDMLQHPEKYIGRRAKIKSKGTYSSGIPRAPVFAGLHEG